MSYVAIKAELKTILDDTGIFTGEVLTRGESAEGYAFGASPSAMVFPTGHENDYLTTDDNLRTFMFNIVILRHTHASKYQTEQDALEANVDTVMDAIDTNQYLNDVVLTTIPVGATFGTIGNASDQMVLAAVIVVKSKKDKSLV